MKTEINWEELRHKRLETLFGCWDVIKGANKDLASNVLLSKRLAAEAVEHYLEEYRALIGRYRIEDKIQRHRIAGLMTASILAKKPLLLIDPDADGARVSRHNEYFALWLGLAICAEGADPGLVASVRRNPMWSPWFSDFLYSLLRPPSGEALSVTFGALSLLYFCDNLAAE